MITIRSADRSVLCSVDADTLAGINLTRTDLTKADLIGADLTRANLAWANLEGANLTGANLTRADLEGTKLTRANLTKADLTRADLAGAGLEEAILSGAVLYGAYFYGAYVYGAYLAGAYLAGADLTGAILEGADLTRAILPDGEYWEKYLSEVVPALLTAGGRPLSAIATPQVWSCHSWENCPIAAAFGASSVMGCPVLLRPRIRQFLQFFDARAIPMPTCLTDGPDGKMEEMG